MDTNQRIGKRHKESPDLFFLAVDVGTTATKAMVFDSSGRVYGHGYREYGISHPQQGWAEQDPAEWWAAVVHAVNDACREPAVKQKIVSISVSSQREGVVPVDKDGTPLSSCIIWLDTRTSAQAKEIASAIDPDTVSGITGLRVSPVFSAAKILWIRKHQPEVYRRAYKFLQPEEFILSELTGEFISEDSIASRTMLFDIRRRRWSEEILGVLSIPEAIMPNTVAPGTIVGTLRAKAAEALGLSTDVKVIAAGGDQQVGLVGVGAITGGRAVVSLGTSTSVCMMTMRPVIDAEARVSCSCGAIPGGWDLEAPIWTTGALLRWFRDQFGQMEVAAGGMLDIDPYDLLVGEAAKSPVGAKGLTVLPHFAGAGAPYWDPDVRGMIYGLRLDHTRGDIIRAIMEGVCCNIRKIIKVFDSLGAPVEEVVLTGGGAKSPVWRQMIADVIGMKVLVPQNTEAVLLGSATLSSVTLGVHVDLASATDAMASEFDLVDPSDSETRLYEDVFAKYEYAHNQMTSSH